MTPLVGLVLLASLGLNPADDAPKGAQWVYVGTYTGGGSRGIYRLSFDPDSGKLGPPELAAESANPSFLAIHPTRRFLYAVNEVMTFDGQPSGSVGAFTIDPKTGALAAIDVESSVGTGPCHLTVDRDGKALLVANYGGGSVACLPLLDNGRVERASSFVQHEGSSVDAGRQKEPHAHSINLDPSGRFAVAADLGLDKVLVYKFNPSKPSIEPNDPPSAKVAPGSGPRHFAFHPDGTHAYVINEMKSTVTAFDFDPKRGVLTETQTISTLPDDFKGSSSTAEVQVHPSGRFLFGSNRGHDSIAAFSIDPKTGKLTALGQTPTGGKTPRNFGIDATGGYLVAANQDSNSLVVFLIDTSTGKLIPTGQTVAVGKPVCVKFVTRE